MASRTTQSHLDLFRRVANLELNSFVPRVVISSVVLSSCKVASNLFRSPTNYLTVSRHFIHSLQL